MLTVTTPQPSSLAGAGSETCGPSWKRLLGYAEKAIQFMGSAALSVYFADAFGPSVSILFGGLALLVSGLIILPNKTWFRNKTPRVQNAIKLSTIGLYSLLTFSAFASSDYHHSLSKMHDQQALRLENNVIARLAKGEENPEAFGVFLGKNNPHQSPGIPLKMEAIRLATIMPMHVKAEVTSRNGNMVEARFSTQNAWIVAEGKRTFTLKDDKIIEITDNKTFNPENYRFGDHHAFLQRQIFEGKANLLGGQQFQSGTCSGSLRCFL